MNNDQLGHALALFDGNRTVLGTEEGGCVRTTVTSEWDDQLTEHWTGAGPPVGVYPMIPPIFNGGEWTVAWGCIDYDEGDHESFIHAVNTAKILDAAAGVTGWIERSRSKGYHVWVFADCAVPAIKMRKALLAAAQIAGAPLKEINPKQVELPEGKVGNYVRLPYPGNTSAIGSGRVVVTWAGLPLELGDFIDLAWDSRCTPDMLDKMGAHYKPPRTPAPRKPLGTELTGTWRHRLDGLSWTMINGSRHHAGGPYDGQDRSSWLWKLCNRMIEHSQLTDEEMLEALVYAHDTWTSDKFSDRAELELERMLRKALDQHDTPRT